MILCMCGYGDCPGSRTLHQHGDGPCACGCPMWRPVMVGTELEDDAHDLAHQEAVDGLLAEHQLTTEVIEVGPAGEVWIDLAEEEGDPRG